ncbi:MAG: SufB/SufD family protein [Peptoniphilaceae bacterium]
MKKNIVANELTFKTFNSLDINGSSLELPELKRVDFSELSDEKRDIDEFKNKDYGVSNELVKINEEFGNLYKYYNATKENSVNEVFNIKINDEKNYLYDNHHIVAEKGSKLNLLMNYTSEGTTRKFRSSIIKVLAKENSEVNLFIIQDEKDNQLSLESVFIETENNSVVNISQYELGSSENYTNLQANLVGEESNLNVDSIYFVYKDNYLNMTYNIFQYGKNTESNLLVNGALKDNAYKVFKSNLDFKKGSSFSKGSEEEYAILLDEDVTSISVPILLSHEDNVEGNHAASAGRVDEDLMFYIMTRGFDEKDAQSLIIQSKFSSAIDKIKDEETRRILWDRVLEIVRGN